MRRIYILPALFVFIASCAPTKQDVTFQIVNSSSTNIFVEYVVTENNDTSAMQIIPTESLIIWEVILAEHYTTNWYKDYGISINYITNQAGDTININPNVASYWNYAVGSPHHYYSLSILNSSF